MINNAGTSTSGWMVPPLQVSVQLLSVRWPTGAQRGQRG